MFPEVNRVHKQGQAAKAISARFHTALMSNAKWRKLFQTTAQPELEVKGYHWKFVDSDLIITTAAIVESDLNEANLRDGRVQPFIYKDIEWLELITDNPTKAIEALAAIGHFTTKATASGFQVFGYQ